MLATKLSVREIELIVTTLSMFDWKRNIVAFNVCGVSRVLPIAHECDVLVLSNTGYLTEIEIKRSWVDFLADFKKDRGRSSEFIKYFYYAIPASLYDDCASFLGTYDGDPFCSGFLCYDEDGSVECRGYTLSCEVGMSSWSQDVPFGQAFNRPSKLFLEQQLEVARLAAMRAYGLRKELVKLLKK